MNTIKREAEYCLQESALAEIDPMPQFSGKLAPHPKHGDLIMVIRPNSTWSLKKIDSFLGEQLIPIRLACIAPNSRPVVCSLWYLHAAGALWCATQRTAKVASYLAHHPICGFEVAPEAMPYKGVRGQGKVTISQERGVDVLERLIDRYLGNLESDFARWLLKRASNEVAIKIEPTWITAWDFSPRMKSSHRAAARAGSGGR